LKKVPSVNKKQILVGVVVLIIGLLVYLVDRPADQTYFVSSIGLNISLHNILPNLFGRFGHSLPAFVHVFAFILVTAGLMSCQRRGCVIICLSWFFIDCAFELGQEFERWSLKIVPDWLPAVPLLENAENYFLLGTFDFLDLAGITVGTVAAYFVLLSTMQRRYA